MMRAVTGARFFVPETIYNQRRINLFENATYVAKHYVRLILCFEFDKKLISEFRLEYKAVNMTIWEFFESQKHRVGYNVQWFNYVEAAFTLDEEKAIKIFFDPTKKLNLLQELYFI